MLRTKYCSYKCKQDHSWILGVKLRGDSQRYRGEGKTYVKLEGKHMHRTIMERTLDRKLTSSEVVHHKDGNKRNNDIANLEVLTRSEHTRQHSKDYWSKNKKI